MSKSFSLVAAVALLPALFALAAPAAPRGTNAVPAATSAPAAATNQLPFPVGEELVYSIYWGVIPVGKTRIVSRWVEENGRRLLAIRYRTRSNRLIAKLYPVDDTIEAIIDPAAFKPVRFKIVLREGGHRRDEVTTFDYDRLTAHWESRVKNSRKDLPLEKEARDLVSFMYSLRARQFVPGANYQYRVMADDKIYDLFVKTMAPEKVELPTFGAVNSLRLEPTAAFDGLFVRKGKMTVWVAQDDRNVVTKLVGSVPVASIKVFLTEVRGPGDDSWIRRTRQKAGTGKAAEDQEVEKALRELDEQPAAAVGSR